MSHWIPVAVAALLAACGSEASKSNDQASSQSSEPNTSAVELDACTLLSSAEVQTAAGWTPDTARSETHGGTATCTYSHAQGTNVHTVVLVVGPSTSSFATSAAMAQRRTEQAQRHPELGITVAPVEGLGVPAVSSQSEGSPPTLEASAKGRLVSVTSPDLEVSKTLATKAIARLP
jgi:hypothetical protein